MECGLIAGGRHRATPARRRRRGYFDSRNPPCAGRAARRYSA
ncbi:hypothetical protein N177_3184 [Lutibaculum baratangense AMV1]|uniref:Uncharacterized protein n=1 Tax=Lutibaculum baratangense AMV1 TaxID=631454 RepID=V4RAB3_9HYPH|nr:hypothetical protein N177_3184 [Lutibaculum baratangense AMV1]